MDIYAQNILDRYKKPYHKGLIEGATILHKEANHSCGDVTEVSLNIEGGKISKYGFEGNGCAISMAAADLMGDLIHEMSAEEAINLSKEEVYEMLGIEISVRRSKCALLALLSLQNGLLKDAGRSPISWSAYHL